MIYGLENKIRNKIESGDGLVSAVVTQKKYINFLSNDKRAIGGFECTVQ